MVAILRLFEGDLSMAYFILLGNTLLAGTTSSGVNLIIHKETLKNSRILVLHANF